MKSTFFALIFCLGAFAASAQETLSFGPIVGLNFASISDIPDVVDAKFKPGLTFGGQLTYSSINNWGIGGAVMYSREGVKFKASGDDVKTNLDYLRIPIKGYYFFGENGNSFRPKVFLGPSVGFMLNAKTKVGDNDVDIKDNYNVFDLGVTGGVGFNALISEGTWFNFDAGYTHGLLDVGKSGDGSNRVITATAGVLFGF